jgi:hypothetical protein
MANNVSIGGEAIFKRKYEEFQEEVRKFKVTFDKYRQVVREKKNWTDLQSDFWTETNTDFLSHLDDVDSFLDDVNQDLKELRNPEYPNKLY